MRSKIFFTGIMLLLVFIIIIVYLVLSAQKPPVKEIEEARKNITRAAKINRFNHDSRFYKEAREYYDSSIFYWQKENIRLFCFRNYEKVKYFATEANKLALNSIDKTNHIAYTSKDQSIEILSRIDQKLELFYKLFSQVSHEKGMQKRMNSGKTLLAEGNIAIQKKDYQTALLKLKESEILIDEVFQNAEKRITSYFDEFPVWQGWINKTLSESRKNETNCIIVDKYDRKCHIYKRGVLYKSFDIELSENWLGSKKMQGDKSTPDGCYKVITKKTGKETKYYKAFLLNYPNEEDKLRFQVNKQNGQIGRNAKIGSLIEIHGHGGKGVDWTDGCIALTNADMDEIFKWCQENTPVTIVGSMRTYEQILTSSEK